MAKNTIDTIYEDDGIVAVNKPAGISVGADRTGKANLADLLQKQRKDDKKLRVIHQLDKDASGIIILAKTAESQKKMSRLFDGGLVKMTYLALAASAGDEKTGVIDEPIGEDPKHQQRMRIDLKDGRAAQTKWEKLADFGSISLLAVEPLTHISHPYQIEAHLLHCGMGLVIDPLYGQTEPIMLSSFKHGYRLAKYEVEKPLIERLTLCAYQIEIENYKDSEKLSLVAPLEKKFRATVKMLTKYNRNGEKAFDEQENFTRLVNTETLILSQALEAGQND